MRSAADVDALVEEVVSLCRSGVPDMMMMPGATRERAHGGLGQLDRRLTIPQGCDERNSEGERALSGHEDGRGAEAVLHDGKHQRAVCADAIEGEGGHA